LKRTASLFSTPSSNRGNQEAERKKNPKNQIWLQRSNPPLETTGKEPEHREKPIQKLDLTTPAPLPVQLQPAIPAERTRRPDHRRRRLKDYCSRKRGGEEGDNQFYMVIRAPN
jgi:hypothetical protein